jgi:hypothetical protein
MAKVEDIDKPGGWMVRVITPGTPPIERYFQVYEIDRARAVEFATAKIPVRIGETCEALRPLNTHALMGENMRPGDVKQHV